ncbi:hypothetical protein KJ599_10315, partial [bacterium]|nr:hypothetical protein [bacterium]
LNGENLLKSNNIKEQGKIAFVNNPKNEKIIKKHERLSDSEIKHYQNILQLYGKHGSIGFPKKDTHLQKPSLEDKFILRESGSRESFNKEEQGTLAHVGIHKNNNEIPNKKLRNLSNSKIHFSNTVFQLYKEYGTLEKVGREVGLTRERIRQILERGNRYGLFEYPIKKELISYPFLINYFTKKEELLNELSDCSKKDEMLQALSTDIVNLNRLLEHFNLTLNDIVIYSKKKRLKMQYDEYVEKIKHHPTTTEMREDKEARNIWAKISRYWGSMESFRQEFAYPFIKQGNPRLKEDIREWQQQRSALAILRKKSYMEIILKNISDRGTLDKKYLARECDISEQDCLSILNSMVKRGEIIRLRLGAKTVYMIKE